MELAGRTVLLTGATVGLGRATAATLAARGARLLLSARGRDALEALAASLSGERHAILPADLAEEGAAERLVDEAGPVDVLVANAGLPGAGWLDSFSSEEVRRALRVNLEGPMLMARALYPGMVERGSGHLVFVGSLSGKAASPRTSVYSATKFGLRGFAFALRTDLAPKGVGVSLVAPGFIRDAGLFADSGARTPPGIGTGTAEQVGDAVARAIEKNKIEIVVAPLITRVATHVAAASPTISVLSQAGSTGQNAADEIADGHAANAPDKR
jgi:short-subunit dehydrogenase